MAICQYIRLKRIGPRTQPLGTYRGFMAISYPYLDYSHYYTGHICHYKRLKRIEPRIQSWGTLLRFMDETTTYGKYHVKVGVHHFPETAPETRDSLTSEDRKRFLKQGIAIRLARGRSAQQKNENCLRSASWSDESRRSCRWRRTKVVTFVLIGCR